MGLEVIMAAAELIFDDLPDAPALGKTKSSTNRLDVSPASEGLSNRLDTFGTTQASTGLNIPSSSDELLREGAGQGIDSLPSFEGVSRKPETTFKDTGTSAEARADKQGTLTGAGLGLQLGSAQTGQEELLSTDTAIQVLAGAGLGAVAGGPMGALAGGLAAGVGAFLNTRAAKRRGKEVRAKEERFQKIAREQLAREEKFQKQARFDRLENRDYNRSAAKMQNHWDAYKDFTGQIMGILNSNANLKKRFAKEGF